VTGGADGHVRGGHHPVADEDLDVVDEGQAEVGVHVVAQVHTAAVGDVQRRLDPSSPRAAVRL
jgi:hypothetical protein